MALKEDVQAGLAALDAGTPAPLSLDDEGGCVVNVLIPPSVIKLAGGRLAVRVKLARTGRFFTLLAPVAMTSRDLPIEVLNVMVTDQFFVDRVGGASFAFAVETGMIFASYHWMIESISIAQFNELFRKFCAAAFLLLERMGTIAGKVPGIVTIRDTDLN
jgi:hypothetical protein